MTVSEQPFFFACEGERLLGIISHGDAGLSIGLLIIVGGPQYRIGSHRQFVLLARELARAGIPAMRFDYRGMGDASGAWRSFEDIGPDIGAAIRAFFDRVPGLERVVLWGLCDAASAALFYAYQDARVRGVVLLNPWVRTEEGRARTYLRTYYVRRIFQVQLWQKILHGEFDFGASARSLTAMLRDAIRSPKAGEAPHGAARQAQEIDRSLPLPARMAMGAERFGKDLLIVLSGEDFTAQEFRAAVAEDGGWKPALARNRVSWHEIGRANHTFASREWRDEVASVTRQWLLNLMRDQDART